MAFGISGDVGSQFAQEVARMIAAQQLQQERERQAIMDQQRMDLAQQQQMQRVREHEDSLGIQNRQLEESAANRRDRANQAGVSDLLKQNEVLDQQEKDRAIEALVSGMPQGAGRRVVDLRRRGIPAQQEDVETPEERTTREAGDLTRIGKEADVRNRSAARFRERSDVTQEPLVAVMGPDNQPVLVPRSQAVNKRPASTREQGRPVTSGDAGRIADFDTSLDDLKVLKDAISVTGAASRVGAMLPDVVTELTGWGADAKSRQGVIDRVRQVIGKALEGGVLRREDEYKYVKILPTIGDPPSVAKTKLEGLERAIIQRRQTMLDALSDAGYETNKFLERGGAASGGSGDSALEELERRRRARGGG